LKEEIKMKHVHFAVILFLLALLVCPVISFAASTGGGNPWDDLIDSSPFTGTKLDGTVSIYLVSNGGKTGANCAGSGYETDAYFTVRLSKGFQLYSFQNMVSGICKNDSGTLKLKLIDFINLAILDIFNANLKWSCKAITNVIYNDETGSRSVVADIQIAVKEK
jgi:hypothetical protein